MLLTEIYAVALENITLFTMRTSVRCHELDFLFFVFLPSVRKCRWAMLLKALELDVSFQQVEQASTAGVVPLRVLLLTSGSGSMALPSRGCEQGHHPSGRAAAGA